MKKVLSVIDKRVLWHYFSLVVFIIPVCQPASGQNDSTNLQKYPFITLKAGLTIPIGAFTSFVFDNYEYNEHAVAGYAITMDMSYPIKRTPVYCNLLLNYGKNGFDNNSYILQFPNEIDKAYSIQYHNYNEYTLLAGPNYVIGLNKKTAIDFKLLAGTLFFDNPEIIYSETSSGMAPPQYVGTYTFTIDTKPQKIVAFAFDFGADVRVLINNSWHFLWNMDFCYSEKANAISAVYENSAGTNKVSVSSLHVLLFNIAFGIGYRIGK